jgi:hypothetical protein
MCAANVSKVSNIHINIRMFVAGNVAVELPTELKKSQSFVPVGVSFI